MSVEQDYREVKRLVDKLETLYLQVAKSCNEIAQTLGELDSILSRSFDNDRHVTRDRKLFLDLARNFARSQVVTSMRRRLYDYEKLATREQRQVRARQEERKEVVSHLEQLNAYLKAKQGM